MLIFHHGHSEFLLELADGYRILTDPFDAHVGYPMRRVRCDAVTVSHAHGDHSEVGKAENYTALVDHAGTTVLAPGVVVKGIESWHDDQQGALRGPNRIYILEADGLRIAHLGDLGAWDDALAERLTEKARYHFDAVLCPSLADAVKQAKANSRRGLLVCGSEAIALEAEKLLSDTVL